MKRIACVLVTALALLSRCALSVPSANTQAGIRDFYSFENDMEGWSASGTDLNLDEWSITRSQDIAKDGNTSLRFGLLNRNDEGKIWIEKPFQLRPNQLYQVSIYYTLASAESNPGLAWTIITGALKKSPKTGLDLGPAYRDATQNNRDSSGYAWTKRRYDFNVRTGELGVLYVVIGIAGNIEIGRIYYVDNVQVTLTEMPPESQFYSFENEMEGWTTNSIDLLMGGGPIDSSITRVEELSGEDGLTAVKLDVNDVTGKGKLWIEKGFAVEPRQVYLAEIQYSLATRPFTRPFFRIMTGVLRHHPETADDISLAVQGDADVGWYALWFPTSYHFRVKSKKSNVLYVVIGIAGTEPAHRTYWLDSVTVTLTRQ